MPTPANHPFSKVFVLLVVMVSTWLTPSVLMNRSLIPWNMLKWICWLEGLLVQKSIVPRRWLNDFRRSPTLTWRTPPPRLTLQLFPWMSTNISSIVMKFAPDFFFAPHRMNRITFHRASTSGHNFSLSNTLVFDKTPANDISPWPFIIHNFQP